MQAPPPTASPPSRHPKQGLRAVHWGWLAAVAGAHAAGLAALSGLGGDPQQEPQPAEAAAISVRLLAADAQPRSGAHLASPDPHAAPVAHLAVPARKMAAPPPAQPRGRRADVPAAPPPSAELAAASAGRAAPDTHSPQPQAEPEPGGDPHAPTTRDTSAHAGVKEAAPVTSATAAGASFQAPRYDAAYLENPAPQYPKLSRRRGEQGKVTLRVRVRADGRAEGVEIAHSSGHPRLDDAARETVQSWRFVPARQGETPIESSLLVPIVFRLDD
ncbi:TonB-like protein [Aromatoleum petrolei]|nr:TonB-like protein [Aromatoleum petrolei]